MLLLPFTLCIPLDLSPDVHYVSNYASPTIYPMHSIRPTLRCTHTYPIILLLLFTLCIPLDLSSDVHSVSNYASPTIYPMHFIRTILSSFLSDVVLRLVLTDVRRCEDNAVVLASKGLLYVHFHP